jgi:hypothetical protein
MVHQRAYRHVRHFSGNAIAVILDNIALACGDAWSFWWWQQPLVDQGTGAEHKHFAAGPKRLVRRVW